MTSGHVTAITSLRRRRPGAGARQSASAAAAQQTVAEASAAASETAVAAAAQNVHPAGGLVLPEGGRANSARPPRSGTPERETTQPGRPTQVPPRYSSTRPTCCGTTENQLRWAVPFWYLRGPTHSDRPILAPQGPTQPGCSAQIP